MTRDEVRMFRESAQVLLTLLRCISMKKALSIDSSNQLNFFRLYDACLMDVSVISWCKIFGAEKNQDIHWRKLFPDTTTEVRRNLEVQLEGQSSRVTTLSDEIRKYRDTYAAHHDLDQTKRASAHPHLAPMGKTGLIVYRAVYEVLRGVEYVQGLPSPDRISGQHLKTIEDQWRAISDAAKLAKVNLKDAPS